MTPGYFFGWPVVDGAIAPDAVPNVIPEVVVQFSMTWLGSDTRMLVTDAAGSADIVDVAYPSLAMTLETHIDLPANEGAACWSEYAPQFDAAYVISATLTNISVIVPATGAVKSTIVLDLGDESAEDSAIGGDYLYVLTGVPRIAVVDLATEVQIQDFDISELGDRKSWQGMAFYSSGW